MSRDLTFAQAVKILGSDSEKLHTLDLLLNGAINAATATHRPTDVIKVLKSAKLIADHSLALMRRVNGVIGKTKPQRRHEVLVAAHTIVAVSAFFEALSAYQPLIDKFDIADEDKRVLADIEIGFAVTRLLLGNLIIPCPSPVRSFAKTRAELERRYYDLAAAVSDFVSGLAPWDRLNETERNRIRELATRPSAERVADAAVSRYTERLAELSARRPEFFVWMTLSELQAASTEAAEDRRALTRVGDLLESFHAQISPPGRIANRLAKAYQAELARRLVNTDEADALPGLTIPTADQLYVDPAFRAAVHDETTRPAEDVWWASGPECRDELAEFLAVHLSIGSALELPTLVLGHPGAGKSLFTKVLAARSVKGSFSPVRVELRHVTANAGILDQIEQAMRATVNEAVSWADFAREAAESGHVPLVIFDGLDELLQTWGATRSGFLAEVAEFQRIEAVQERPIVAVVTSRTVVMTQAAIPRGCTMLRLEPFDRPKIAAWVEAWNAAVGSSSPALDFANVLRFPDLAEQPLLLLLLALYNAGPDRSWESTSGEPLRIHGLYEGLLRQFAYREVRKRARPEACDPASIARMIEAELDTLAIVAFSMFNRGRQSISLSALDGDLTALRQDRGQDAESVWSEGEYVVGRFFFIHEARAGGSDAATVVRSYEFLHATFGEYLVARKILHELRKIAKLQAAGLPLHDCDGLLYALLSFAPLIGRAQIIDFLKELLRQPGEQTVVLCTLLIDLFHIALDPHAEVKYMTYRPQRLSVPARYGLYSLNILMCLLAAQSDVSLLTLSSTEVPAYARERWSAAAHLWRSCLRDELWAAFVESVRLGDGLVMLYRGGLGAHDKLRHESVLLEGSHRNRVTQLFDATRRLAPTFDFGGSGPSLIALKLKSLPPEVSEDEIFRALATSRVSGSRSFLLFELLAMVEEDPHRFHPQLVSSFVRDLATNNELQHDKAVRTEIVAIGAAQLARTQALGESRRELASTLGRVIGETQVSGDGPNLIRMLASAGRAGVDPRVSPWLLDAALDELLADDLVLRDALEVAIANQRWEWISQRGLSLIIASPRETLVLIPPQLLDHIRRGVIEYASAAPDQQAVVLDLFQNAAEIWQRARFSLGLPQLVAEPE